MKNYKISVTVLVAVLAVMLTGISVYAGDAAKVNINTASAEELTQLQGIGPKYAAKIIEYREKNGSFAAAEDIMKIPGIGPATFEKNKERIAVE
jgi:competence protein ComEA